MRSIFKSAKHRFMKVVAEMDAYTTEDDANLQLSSVREHAATLSLGTSCLANHIYHCVLAHTAVATAGCRFWLDLRRICCHATRTFGMKSTCQNTPAQCNGGSELSIIHVVIGLQRVLHTCAQYADAGLPVAIMNRHRSLT